MRYLSKTARFGFRNYVHRKKANYATMEMRQRITNLTHWSDIYTFWKFDIGSWYLNWVEYLQFTLETCCTKDLIWRLIIIKSGKLVMMKICNFFILLDYQLCAGVIFCLLPNKILDLWRFMNNFMPNICNLRYQINQKNWTKSVCLNALCKFKNSDSSRWLKRIVYNKTQVAKNGYNKAFDTDFFHHNQE